MSEDAILGVPPKDEEQLMLFDPRPPWLVEWEGMPEFSHEDLTPSRSILVHFESAGDAKKFAELIGQSITVNTKSLWYPDAEITRYMDKRYANE